MLFAGASLCLFLLLILAGLLHRLVRVLGEFNLSIERMGDDQRQHTDSLDRLSDTIGDLQRLLNMAILPHGPIVEHPQLASAQSVNRTIKRA